MANLFLGFPVPRAKIASMIEGTAPPSNHHTQHELGGSDEIDCTGLTGAGGASFPLEAFWLDDHHPEAEDWVTTLNAAGTISRSNHRLILSSGNTAYGSARVRNQIEYPIPTLTWNKERHVIIRIKPIIPSLANTEVKVLSGLGGAHNHIGFQWASGELRGIWGNSGGSHNTTLLTYSVPGDYVETLLHVILYPGSKIEFWVDGVKEGETTQNLPSGLYYAKYLLDIIAMTSINNADARAEFNHVQFYQEG